MIPTREATLLTDVDAPREAAPLVKSDTGPMAMFERFATDPAASVEKIERLMALWERNEARNAEGEFNRAMAAAQAEMRAVTADAYNPQTRSKYASYEALDAVLRPIYTKHGFGMSFNTGEGAPELHVRVLCDVTHVGGHSKPYRLDMPADGKGAKGGDVMTKTHATGSALSYGMRYLLKMIWNVAVGEGDDDGNRAGRKPPAQVAQAPAGYDDWLTDLAAVADEGLPKLKDTWAKSRQDYRKHLQATDAGLIEQLKAKATKVKAS